jgi:hypothetical protein
LRGQFDKAFIPLNRARFVLVPRGSASSHHSMRCMLVISAQLLLGHTKIEGTVRYLGITKDVRPLAGSFRKLCDNDQSFIGTGASLFTDKLANGVLDFRQRESRP